MTAVNPVHTVMAPRMIQSTVSMGTGYRRHWSMELSADTRVAVLVEGTSDKVAVEALAARLEIPLDGVTVVALGGVTNIGNFLTLFRGFDLTYAGLCDAGEERYFLRALERAGLGKDLNRERMRELGFFVCEPDLEGELIRALGIPGVEAVVDSLGDLNDLRVFQNQPYHRSRPPEDQLHRFMGTMSGRKAKYARALVAALDLDRVPEPLRLLLAYMDEHRHP